MFGGIDLIVYRYEYEDGGGPFLTRDGVSRTNSELKFDDNTLYGCDSIENLKKWFAVHNITLPDGMMICAYDGEVVKYLPTTGEVVIIKDTAKRI